jgi:hypothetical protein
MNTNDFIILTGCLLCAAVGALATHLYYRSRLASKERESWRQARLFYTRKSREQESSWT